MRKILISTMAGIFFIFHITAFAQSEYLMEQLVQPPKYSIVFMKTVDSQNNLYMMDRDGSNEVQLTKTGATDPVVSYNGELIVYKKGHYTNYKNILVDLNNGSVKNILDHNVDVYSISKDNKKIVYGKYADPRRYIYKELYIANIDGSQETKLISGEDVWEAAFSPTENKIAYIKEGKIFVMDFDTKEVLQLTSQGVCTDISWSSDGSTIVYCGPNYEIMSIQKDGSGSKVLFKKEDMLIATPVIAPDGSQIIFNNMADGQIYSIKTDGTGLNKLTDINVTEFPSWLKVNLKFKIDE